MKKFFKKVRFFFFFIWALFKKHRKLLLLGFIIGIITSVLLPIIGKKIFSKNTERIGILGKFTYDKLPMEVQQKIGEGLTEVSLNGEVFPKLAESWEINKDGKEYIFTLKENLFWHDGKPVKAADVNYNFSDVTTTALDDRKIKFELKEPFSPFFSVVSQPLFKKDWIGTGEYKIKKIKRNGQLVEKVLLVAARGNSKKKIDIKFYPTEEAIRTAFKLGEIDVIQEISHPEELTSWKKIKITLQVKYNRFVGIFFNTSNGPLAKKSVRQALAYAIQKRWPYRALTPINPHSWVYNPNVKPYSFDLRKAKEFLRKENGEEIKEIELSVFPSLLEVAENIKNDWEKLGILVKIKVTNNLEDNFQAILATQEIPTDPDQYIFWHSTQEFNITKYKSPKVDKLLEEGRKNFEMEKRKELYQEFQKTLAEDVPVVFLFHPIVYTISRI